MMTGETILVIDTDSETMQNIASTLESEDFLVFTAPSGDVGITMAKKVNPKLIFINPAMAGTSGLEICKTIHSIDALKNVPIVILSAFEGKMDPRYASIYGIVDSLKKPFSPEDLVSKTKNVLSGKPVVVQAAPAAEAKAGPGQGKKATLAEEAMAMEDETLVIQKDESFEDVGVFDKTIVTTKKELDTADKTIIKPRKNMEFSSDKTIVKQPQKPAEVKKAEQIYFSPDEPEKKPAERERAYVLKKQARRRDMRSGLIVSIVAILVIILLGSGGFILYKKGLLPWIKTEQKVASIPLPSKPVPQQPVVPPPLPEQPKPQLPVPQPAVKSAPVAKAHAPGPAKPAPAPKSDVKKQADKAIYSIQVGSFKNANNAEALVKKYKDKGYEAFAHKSTLKNQETLYRVLVGKFDSRKEASKFAAAISAKEKTKAFIFKE